MSTRNYTFVVLAFAMINMSLRSCALNVTRSRRLETIISFDHQLFDDCVRPVSVSEGLFDVLYVVHSKDLGPLGWSIKSAMCHINGIGRIWVISDDHRSVHNLLSDLSRDLSVSRNLGEDRLVWFNEKDFPFKLSDVEHSKKCHGNCGWYFQQLLKLYAGRILPGVRDYLVCDADVVWFGKDIKMVAERVDGLLPTAYFYNTAAQFHREYFDQIKRLTGGSVERTHPQISGVAHHMIFKLNVLESLMKFSEKQGNSRVFWRAVLEAVDGSIEIAFSEYELYLNYALKYFPESVKLRHLSFANGPKFGLVYNGGDEGKSSWISEIRAAEKQMLLDKKTGFDYIGYHNYARKRYYDVPLANLPHYCVKLGVAKRNAEMSKKCDEALRVSRNREHRRLNLPSTDPHILNNCTEPLPASLGLFDVVYVVHSKDLGPLKWGMQSLVCRMKGVGKIWIVSDDHVTVHSLLEELALRLGSDRISWFDEKKYPFRWGDVDQYMKCGSNCGWYFQQLLKLMAGRVIPGIRDYLVCDADLVWYANDLDMISSIDPRTGYPAAYYYNTAAQNHRAYFEHISRLTGSAVKRVHPKISGVVHHMVFKIQVLEELMKLCEKHANGETFWKALLMSVNPKAYNSVSEYELYLNYALEYFPNTVSLRHITFANGPRPGLVSNGGDEASMRNVWSPAAHGFEKQMALDQRLGYAYVGYHSYAKRRYYDVPWEEIHTYCEMGIRGVRNSDMEKSCARISLQ